MYRIALALSLITLTACNQNENNETTESTDISIDPIEINQVAVTAGDDQIAPPNTIITLSGTQRGTVGVLWFQVQGTPAEIEAPESLTTNVTIPDLTESEILRFQLVGINESGLYMAFDEVQIEIVL